MVGEEGIGKSALATEIANRAVRAGLCLLRGRATTTGPRVPFRPLAEALLSYYRTGTADLGPYQAALGRIVPELAPGAHGGSLITLAEAVLRLLAGAGRDGGCLMVLEDLQDADPETLSVVEYLVDNLADQPALLVGTVHTDRCDAIDVARACARRGSATLIELDRLTRDDIGSLAAGWLDTAGEIPAAMIDRLWEDSGGNPSVAGELLHGMLGNGLLTRADDGWRFAERLGAQLPSAFVRRVARRADRLGPQGRRVLSTAAVLGNRFPLPEVQTVTGVDDADLIGHLHGAIEAGLVVVDEPPWYRFSHPLTARALLRQLGPCTRATLAGQAARAVESLHPGLPGRWRDLAVDLRLAAGDRVSAARLLAFGTSHSMVPNDSVGCEGTGVVGERIEGAPAGLDARPLDRAWELLSDGGGVGLRADVLERLLLVLAETGSADRVEEVRNRIDELADAGLAPPRLADLQAGLARIACAAGRWADGFAAVNAARAMLGPVGSDRHTATVDAVAAQLVARDGVDDDLAAELAHSAAAAAERAGLPDVACEAWQALGIVARRRDLDESNAYFERSRSLACTHHLPIRRLHAVHQLGLGDWLGGGDVTRLRQARRDALRLRAPGIGCDAATALALDRVLRGDCLAAATALDECEAEADRLGLAETGRRIQLVRATLAAHQAMRDEMDAALARFRRRGGTAAAGAGLTRVFCALFEEDRVLAREELTRADDHPLTGGAGLALLLDVLAGQAGWRRYREVAGGAAARLRWNRQFIMAAGAVLLGGDGRGEEAAAAMAEAARSAAAYPPAAHLGLRLVAEPAIADRWGEPVAWLVRAEDHFHRSGLSAPAGVCRTLLRERGVPTARRRQIPPALRTLGITLREYEVFQILVDRADNRTIAERLHISPRTVEKHVASLILKSGRPNRAALCDFALRLRGLAA